MSPSPRPPAEPHGPNGPAPLAPPVTSPARPGPPNSPTPSSTHRSSSHLPHIRTIAPAPFSMMTDPQKPILFYDLVAHKDQGAPLFSPNTIRARLAFAVKGIPIETVEVRTEAECRAARECTFEADEWKRPPADDVPRPPLPLDREARR